MFEKLCARGLSESFKNLIVLNLSGQFFGLSYLNYSGHFIRILSYIGASEKEMVGKHCGWKQSVRLVQQPQRRQALLETVIA